jgi:serine/threonine protein kinase
MFPYLRSSAVTHLQMSHSFIVRLHFAFQSDDEYFFVLDFMAGGDFFAFLKRHRKLDENQTRFYAAEVLLALEYMHCYEPPIAYRDLKPENIMIGIDGHIKLTDFGFAKFFGEEIDPFGAAGSPRRERSHSIVGSAFYIAPEIVNSSKTEGHDLAVDFWSFGCLIYEMVCGHALFADPKSEAMFSQMKKSGQISKGATFQQFTMYYLFFSMPPLTRSNVARHRLLNTKESAVFPASVSKPLLSLLNNLLQRNPDLRCKSWAEVKQHEFFKVMCPPPPPPPPFQALTRSHTSVQSIDFTKLLEKRIDPPFVPSLSKGYQDISMFEDATAVDISISRPASKGHRPSDPGSPDAAQVQGFHFQAKTSQILTESAKKTRPLHDPARAPRPAPAEIPVFSNMRKSKSSESLDSIAKQAGPAAPTIELMQTAAQSSSAALDRAQRSPSIQPSPTAAAPLLDRSQRTSSEGSNVAQSSPPAAPVASSAAAAPSPAPAPSPPVPLPPALTPAELAVQFFASCGWESKAAAALLIEALADQKNPQLSDKKFQHAAAIFSNEITSAIL